MMDFDGDSTRPDEMGEWATTAREPSFLSIGAKTIWADGRDQTIGSTPPDTGDLASRVADICTRLPPPPIPPWLENSPDRLRHLMSNYSCWERYAELCSVNIPNMKSSSRTQMEDLLSNDEMEDPTVSRLLPFLAAITVGLLMVAVIAVAYFWHQRKRRKFSFSAKYLTQPSPTRDYCSPNFYMTPSVTVETQLSLCALVDDNFRIQPYSIYKEEAWPYNNVIDATSNSSAVYETLSSSGLRKNNEILLQPDQLGDYEQDEPFYPSTQTLYRSDAIDSTFPLPVEHDRNVKVKDNNMQDFSLSHHHHQQQRHIKRKDRQKLHSCQTPMLLETNSNSPYVQIQSLHDFPDSSNDDDCHSTMQLNQIETSSTVSSSTKRKGGGVGGAMRKCKDAGNKVISKLPWKINGLKSTTSQPIISPSYSSSPPSSSSRKLDRPIRALRQSLKGLRGSISHRRLHHHTSPEKPSDSNSRMVLPSSDDEHTT